MPKENKGHELIEQALRLRSPRRVGPALEARLAAVAVGAPPAARPVNLLVYPFRWLWNENAADFRTHQIGGKFKKGYLVNLEKAAWDVE